MSYGGDWFASAGYSGPRKFDTPAEYAAYVGRYHNGNAWGGDVEVYVLKGQLAVSGDRLTQIGGALFRPGDEPWAPETAEFLHVFEGKAMLLKLAGMDFFRVEVD